MHQTACLDIPALPLQLLLRRHPEWREHPVAVVDQDRPQGRILWMNDRARAAGIQPGMRFAAALSCSGALRAAEVPRSLVERAVASLTGTLREFTPGVEPADEAPGTFWLDVSGLDLLYPSLPAWAALIRNALGRQRLECRIAVGFSKFGTYVIARAESGVTVLRDRAEEETTARRVPLDRLDLDRRTYQMLSRLGLATVGDFADLPPAGIVERFDEGVARIHRLARGVVEIPLAASPPPEPLARCRDLEEPETDAVRLLEVLQDLLGPLLEALARRELGLAALRIRFGFEGGVETSERIRPAAPTLDASQVLELIRLRVSSMRFPSGVVRVALAVETGPLPRRQLELFESRPVRDPAAARRALARLRAEFGERTVVRARLRDGHLPAARFLWEPFDPPPRARPMEGAGGALVRRFYEQPLMLPPRPRHEPDGWMLRTLEQGPIVRVRGPYVISGGWWRKTVHREYYFAETRKGEVLWVYYDRFRRRWFLQGRLE